MIDKNAIGERFTVRLDDGRLYSGCIIKVTDTGIAIDAALHLGPGDPVVVEMSTGKRIAAEVVNIKFHGNADLIDVTLRLGDY